jgi:amidohydrolase
MKPLEAAKGLREKLVAWRRHLHAHPERSREERETAEYVARELRSFGLKVNTRVSGTAVVADLDISGSGRRIAFRADMDALPVAEDSDLPYKSRNPGVAHVCGHDAHMAMVLGAAKLLADARGELGASVRFMFQPSEESPPGGARGLVEAGALEGVDEIYGLHVHPGVACGRIAVMPGPMLASADDFTITVTGRPAHGAMPHAAVDPIVAAAEIVLALQTLVSRRTDPTMGAVVSVCKVDAGSAFNVIPESAELRGTMRALGERARGRLMAGLKRIAGSVARAHGAAAEVDFRLGYPPLVNPRRGVERVLAAYGRLFGERREVVDLGRLFVGEDFSYYLGEAPGAFFWLGAKPRGKGKVHGHHHPAFRLNEDALPVGAAIFAELALSAERPEPKMRR